MVHFQCPCCQSVLAVENATMARTAPCPQCGQLLFPPAQAWQPPQNWPRVLQASPRLSPTLPPRDAPPPPPFATGEADPPPPQTIPFPSDPEVLYSADIEIPAESQAESEPPQPEAPDQPAPVVAPRFVPVPYRPEGGFGFLGLPLMLGILLLGAALLGWLASFVGRWYYVILLYPLAMGIGLAFIGFYAVHVAKVRNPTLAGMVGALSALVAIGTMHYCDYQHVLADLDSGESRLPLVVRATLSQRRGFEVYLVSMARLGLTVVGRGESGFHLGEVATITYWLVELLVVGSLTVIATRSEAHAPFCSECGEWKEERPLGHLQGHAADLVHLCRKGELAVLPEHAIPGERGELAVSAWVCPHCGVRAPIELRLEQGTMAAHASGAPALLHLTFPGEAYPMLEQMFNPETRVA